MNVSLKPFDFAQAVARAGLQPNGQPIQRNKGVEGPGFQQALSQALQGVSQTQTRASDMQRAIRLFTNLVTSGLPNFGSGNRILFLGFDFLISQ